MTFPVEEDVAPNPRDVSLFGPPAIVTGTHGVPNPVEKSRGLGVGGADSLATSAVSAAAGYVRAPFISHISGTSIES